MAKKGKGLVGMFLGKGKEEVKEAPGPGDKLEGDEKNLDHTDHTNQTSHTDQQRNKSWSSNTDHIDHTSHPGHIVHTDQTNHIDHPDHTGHTNHTAKIKGRNKSKVWVKITRRIRPDLWEKVKRAAYWKRKSDQDIINKALEQYFEGMKLKQIPEEGEED